VSPPLSRRLRAALVVSSIASVMDASAHDAPLSRR